MRENMAMKQRRPRVIRDEPERNPRLRVQNGRVHRRRRRKIVVRNIFLRPRREFPAASHRPEVVKVQMPRMDLRRAAERARVLQDDLDHLPAPQADDMRRLASHDRQARIAQRLVVVERRRDGLLLHPARLLVRRDAELDSLNDRRSLTDVRDVVHRPHERPVLVAVLRAEEYDPPVGRRDFHAPQRADLVRRPYRPRDVVARRPVLRRRPRRHRRVARERIPQHGEPARAGASMAHVRLNPEEPVVAGRLPVELRARHRVQQRAERVRRADVEVACPERPQRSRFCLDDAHRVRVNSEILVRQRGRADESQTVAAVLFHVDDGRAGVRVGRITLLLGFAAVELAAAGDRECLRVADPAEGVWKPLAQAGLLFCGGGVVPVAQEEFDVGVVVLLDDGFVAGDDDHSE